MTDYEICNKVKATVQADELRFYVEGTLVDDGVNYEGETVVKIKVDKLNVLDIGPYGKVTVGFVENWKHVWVPVSEL